MEFTALAHNNLDLDSYALREYLFFTRTGFDPGVFDFVGGDHYPTELPADWGKYRLDVSSLKDKRVLDAGCGPGRFTEVAASYASEVVGIDIGNHIQRARDRLSQFDNTTFVQGSVLRPPFRAHSFDVVFSVGVIHHTPNPREACMELARLVAPGGMMSIWVYPSEYWGNALKAVVGRLLHKNISRMSRDRALHFCTRYLYPLGRLQMKLATKTWLKYLFAPLFIVNIPRHPVPQMMIATIFDYYGPPIISTHTAEEVTGWMEEAGFDRVQSLPVPTSVIAHRRV